MRGSGNHCPVGKLGALTTPPFPVALVSVTLDSPFAMAHHRRQIGGRCNARRARDPLQPRGANQRPPVEKVDLMVSSVSRSLDRQHDSSSSLFIENGLPR